MDNKPVDLPVARDYVYIVMAYRYGEELDNSYFVGWSNSLVKAKKMADDEWDDRGRMKYSGVVYECSENGNGKVEVYRKGL